MLLAHLPSQGRGRRGLVAVLVAVCLTALLGVVAVAIDGGILMEERRHAQAAADAAALAGAADLFKRYRTGNGQDTAQGNAKTSALTNAGANGYSNDGTNSIVTIRISPQAPVQSSAAIVDGNGMLLPGYIEVIIQSNRVRSFSALFASGNMSVLGRAVARGQWAPSSPGLLVLDYGGKGTFSVQGGGAFTESGAAVVINSNDPNALIDAGTGTVIATEFDITGGLSVGSRATLKTSPIPNNINEGVSPTADPLAYLPAPSAPPAAPAIQVTKNYTDPVTGNKYNNYYLLSPGSYGGASQPSLPNFTNGDLVVFQQASAGNNGIYYLTAGGFNANGADIRMDTGSTGGMMMYNAGTGTSDGIKLTGNPNGSVTITPLTSGTYQGLSFFQDRLATENLSITGNGAFNITGTIYAANATLKIAGNGSTTANIGSQWIAKDVSITGQGNVGLTYSSGSVGRTRLYGLVE
jgi:hypothetical protein